MVKNMSKMLVQIIIFTNFFSDFKMDLNILKIVMSGFPGKISSYELGILGKDNLILPCGVCARDEK